MVLAVGHLGAVKHVVDQRGTNAVEHAWIWSVIGYTILRFVIAWGAFADHGANVWVFGLLDIGTAWPYAKAVAVICRRAADGEWKRLRSPVTIALASFFAPYGYLWFAAGEMPGGLRIGLAVCVLVVAAAATVGAASRTKNLRRGSANRQHAPARANTDEANTDEANSDLGDTDQANSDLGDTDPRDTEILIDLTGNSEAVLVSVKSYSGEPWQAKKIRR